MVQRDAESDSTQEAPASPWESDSDRSRRRFGARTRAPRTRLNQALTVASGASSASIDPWGDGMERPPARRDAEPIRYRSEEPAARSEWGAARQDVFGPRPTESKPEAGVSADDPVHVVVDLRAKALPASTGDASSNYGLGRTWGTHWRDAAQGWVPDQFGAAVWRPVVATTAELASWDIRTYLGIVTAEVAVEARGGDFKQLGATLTRAREMATEGLVEEAIARGAHAVVGVDMDYTAIGGRLLMTVTGTAVTLKEKDT